MDTTQHSLLNDQKLKDISILAIVEPHSWRKGETLTVAPMVCSILLLITGEAGKLHVS
jgi:hypothetical protein